jgi:hypothetical protein
MASIINGRTHYFHADVSAFGGQLEQPFEKPIPLQASLSLSPSGGYASTRVENFHLEGLFSFKSAHTQVSGRPSKKHSGWTTLASSAVEGLNIGDVVTADRVVSQVATVHSAKEKSYAPKVSFIGTHFENLRINGHLIEIDLKLDLCKPGKADADGFPDALTINDPAFQAAAGIAPVQQTGDNAKASGKGHVLCSLFENVKAIDGVKPDPKAPAKNLPWDSKRHVFTIPDFGTIYLAELIVDCNSYQLTMIRAELGCPVHASASVAASKPNGHTEP